MTIYLFTGPSASGKSTIANRLGKNLGISILGERGILHRLAASYGHSRTRDWLAVVGMKPILDEALGETVRLVREEPGDIIIDGSYDGRLPETLEREIPTSKVVIVAITASEQRRREWMTQRFVGDFEAAKKELAWIDYWKMQAGMESIMQRANVVIKNESTVDEAVEELLVGLRKEGGCQFISHERMVI